jgi:hypothetical protein
MKVTISTLALLLILGALPAAAQSYDWSNVGSVGIALRGDGHVFTGPDFTFASFLTGTLTARYNVTNTAGGGDKTPAWTTFTIATTTSGSANVTARLMQVDKCSNQESNICEITADGTGTGCDTCTFGSSTFDFANNFYYIQVNLNRSSSSDTATLHSVAVN